MCRVVRWGCVVRESGCTDGALRPGVELRGLPALFSGEALPEVEALRGGPGAESFPEPPLGSLAGLGRGPAFPGGALGLVPGASFLSLAEGEPRNPLAAPTAPAFSRGAPGTSALATPLTSGLSLTPALVLDGVPLSPGLATLALSLAFFATAASPSPGLLEAPFPAPAVCPGPPNPSDFMFCSGPD